MAVVECDGRTTREINVEIKRLVAKGETELSVSTPGARHNLGVAILESVHITFDGSVGYYCAGMIDGPNVTVNGSAGWGLAESMLNGVVTVNGNAGNGAAASIRGGEVVIRGDVAARTAVSMKGGTVVVTGNCGYMAGFMAQQGTLIVCGDAGEAFADSMYEAVCFVGGKIAELGNDTVIQELTSTDKAALIGTFDRHAIDHTPSSINCFRKIVSGRKLWNFDKRDWTTWREAL